MTTYYLKQNSSFSEASFFHSLFTCIKHVNIIPRTNPNRVPDAKLKTMSISFTPSSHFSDTKAYPEKRTDIQDIIFSFQLNRYREKITHIMSAYINCLSSLLSKIYNLRPIYVYNLIH